VASTAAPRSLLSYAAARARALEAARPLPEELVPLAEARGRALRRPVTAPHALPPFRNSAMDGFAVRTRDLAGASAAHPAELAVAETVGAGSVPSPRMPARSAVRIMTGALVPPQADAVVPLENAEVAGATVRFRAAPATGANIREAGRDLAQGDLALEPGRELSPHDLALLAALGVARVPVGSRPRAVVLSTGNELLEVTAALEPGRIRDSNATLLRALLEEGGARLERIERLPDDPARVSAAIAAGIRDADLVVSVGGVSVGDFDPVARGLGDLPWIGLHRVAMRPGQHQAFGALDGRLFFGLPGNPASVACLFEVLVRPALRKLQGFAGLDRPRLEVRVAEAIVSRAGRTDFVRVTLERREREWWARPAGDQVSGHLMPQVRAHALLEVAEERERLAAGDAASALLLRWPE